ncbi:MAG: hypothetical protein GX328_00935 [Clostridiaceae bacterium]|nr:hypothetical protein [Clostridiaceae bacterium]
MNRFSKTVEIVNLVLFILNLIGSVGLGLLIPSNVLKPGAYNWILALALISYSVIQWLVGRCIYHHFKNQETLLEINGVQYKN